MNETKTLPIAVIWFFYQCQLNKNTSAATSSLCLIFLVHKFWVSKNDFLIHQTHSPSELPAGFFLKRPQPTLFNLQREVTNEIMDFSIALELSKTENAENSIDIVFSPSSSKRFHFFYFKLSLRNFFLSCRSTFYTEIPFLIRRMDSKMPDKSNVAIRIDFSRLWNSIFSTIDSLISSINILIARYQLVSKHKKPNFGILFNALEISGSENAKKARLFFKLLSDIQNQFCP